MLEALQHELTSSCSAHCSGLTQFRSGWPPCASLQILGSDLVMDNILLCCLPWDLMWLWFDFTWIVRSKITFSAPRRGVWSSSMPLPGIRMPFTCPKIRVSSLGVEVWNTGTTLAPADSMNYIKVSWDTKSKKVYLHIRSCYVGFTECRETTHGGFSQNADDWPGIIRLSLATNHTAQPKQKNKGDHRESYSWPACHVTIVLAKSGWTLQQASVVRYCGLLKSPHFFLCFWLGTNWLKGVYAI